MRNIALTVCNNNEFAGHPVKDFSLSRRIRSSLQPFIIVILLSTIIISVKNDKSTDVQRFHDYVWVCNPRTGCLWFWRRTAVPPIHLLSAPLHRNSHRKQHQTVNQGQRKKEQNQHNLQGSVSTFYFSIDSIPINFFPSRYRIWSDRGRSSKDIDKLSDWCCPIKARIFGALRATWSR